MYSKPRSLAARFESLQRERQLLGEGRYGPASSSNEAEQILREEERIPTISSSSRVNVLAPPLPSRPSGLKFVGQPIREVTEPRIIPPIARAAPTSRSTPIARFTPIARSTSTKTR